MTGEVPCVVISRYSRCFPRAPRRAEPPKKAAARFTKHGAATCRLNLRLVKDRKIEDLKEQLDIQQKKSSDIATSLRMVSFCCKNGMQIAPRTPNENRMLVCLLKTALAYGGPSTMIVDCT